jgi:outer membrane protein assembly factor BamD
VLLLMSGLFLLSAATCDAQFLHKKKKKAAVAGEDENVQPDKILYDRALKDIKHGRYDSGRLNLQTLINTYPDSEFLAKAKLSIADAYFKEGGTANLTQAIAGYKDFIVFFPFLQEAAYAQKQVAMAHYNQMEKPDRDRTQAKLAEEEFQTFLQKYPNDALAANAEQRLREVQEVLAEGEYRVGYYYYVKGDPKAAAGRLLSVTQRYPLYSRSDHALWMLGDLFERSEHKDIAAAYYAQIVRNYPKSSMVGNAKNKLVAFNVPVPQPDPAALARMTADQNTPRPHVSLVKRPMAILRNGPGSELRTASTQGTPNMKPESETTSAIDILTGGGAPRLGGAGSGSRTGIVATVTPGTANGAENSGTSTDGNSANSPAVSEGPEATGPAPASVDSPAAGPSTGDPASTTNGAATNTAAPAGDATAKTDSSSSTDSAESTKTDHPQNGSSSSSGKESSSKKKKGLRKVIPW